MPYYHTLRNFKIENRTRIVNGIKRIREQFIDEYFPSKKAEDSLILGTWNIRNFDDNRFNYGPRSTESLFYIAEIISKFDVVAVQEICEDLKPLERMIDILGDKQYDYIITDVTHWSLGGNKERLGFIYDKTKVWFTGVVGEIVLPDNLLISESTDKGRQFSRTPFGVEFQSRWFKFVFSTVHIFFGSNTSSTPQYRRRVEEIKAIASYLAKDAIKSESNHILVGDFNIIEEGSEGYDALQSQGFKVVKNKLGSNRDQTKFYDQISFLSRRNELELLEADRDDRVFQFFNSVYRNEDYELYKPILVKMMEKAMKKYEEQLASSTSDSEREKINNRIIKLQNSMSDDETLKEYYLEWRTFQVSDHLPLWIEIKINFSNQYLDSLIDE